jgi:membrane protease YdiL (CAAX protease family)
MNNKTLLSYFVILAILCAGFVAGARMMGQQGVYLAGAYMLTPALAAILTRLFFHPPHFKDARLGFGRFRDYIRFWLYSLGITALSYALFTLSGAIRWDFSGKVFLDLLAQQFALTGQDMMAGLPPGFTPQMMLWLFVIGDFTLFNILPGILSGFGEEFGHRGLMFPLLLRDRPWLGLLVGGFIWYLWHQPLALVIPAPAPVPLWQALTRHALGIVGITCTHVYLCYVYMKSGNIWVPSLAHIALNNAARGLSYFVVIQDQFTADIFQYLAMLLVVVLLYFTRELDILRQPFPPVSAGDAQPPAAEAVSHP